MLWNLYFFMVLTHNRESFWTQRYKRKNLDVAEKLASAWASLRHVSFIIRLVFNFCVCVWVTPAKVQQSQGAAARWNQPEELKMLTTTTVWRRRHNRKTENNGSNTSNWKNNVSSSVISSVLEAWPRRVLLARERVLAHIGVTEGVPDRCLPFPFFWFPVCLEQEQAGIVIAPHLRRWSSWDWAANPNAHFCRRFC